MALTTSTAYSNSTFTCQIWTCICLRFGGCQTRIGWFQILLYHNFVWIFAEGRWLQMSVPSQSNSTLVLLSAILRVHVEKQFSQGQIEADTIGLESMALGHNMVPSGICRQECRTLTHTTQTFLIAAGSVLLKNREVGQGKMGLPLDASKLKKVITFKYYFEKKKNQKI